jgi:hypothetical protein
MTEWARVPIKQEPEGLLPLFIMAEKHSLPAVTGLIPAVRLSTRRHKLDRSLLAKSKE